MSHLKGKQRATYVHDMFGRIAGRYDQMNRIMTMGQDMHWRQTVIRHAALQAGEWLLDLGAGTGDLSHMALEGEPTAHVIAADFTVAMMRMGMQRYPNPASPKRGIAWTGAEAGRLPFPDERFDVVISGFLVRNLGDLPGCLTEMQRVLKPGGRVVVLDTTPPPPSRMRPLLEFYLHDVIPTLGSLIAGQSEAYRYLPESTENFLEPEKLAVRLMEAGFTDVRFERRMFGTVAIHWGRKL